MRKPLHFRASHYFRVGNAGVEVERVFPKTNPAAQIDKYTFSYIFPKFLLKIRSNKIKTSLMRYFCQLCLPKRPPPFQWMQTMLQSGQSGFNKYIEFVKYLIWDHFISSTFLWAAHHQSWRWLKARKGWQVPPPGCSVPKRSPFDNNLFPERNNFRQSRGVTRTALTAMLPGTRADSAVVRLCRKFTIVAKNKL